MTEIILTLSKYISEVLKQTRVSYIQMLFIWIIYLVGISFWLH